MDSAAAPAEDPPPASLAFVDALPNVLLHADWLARGAAPAVCREWARPLQARHGGPIPNPEPEAKPEPEPEPEAKPNPNPP